MLGPAGPGRAVARPVSAGRGGLERGRLSGRLNNTIRRRHKRGMAWVAATGVTLDHRYLNEIGRRFARLGSWRGVILASLILPTDFHPPLGATL